MLCLPCQGWLQTLSLVQRDLTEGAADCRPLLALPWSHRGSPRCRLLAHKPHSPCHSCTQDGWSALIHLWVVNANRRWCSANHFLECKCAPPSFLSSRRGSRSRSSESNRIGAGCIESSKRVHLLVGLYSFIMAIRSLRLMEL